MKNTTALLVVDIQNDFCPGGSLGVKGGDTIIPRINAYLRLFSGQGGAVFATRDWHPRKTSHFKEFGGVWPVHCVQKTQGARFHEKLRLPPDAVVISKGMDPRKDSYSAFQAIDSNGNSLKKLLRRRGVKTIYIAGIATDYCVRWTALDGLKKGFRVHVLTDAIKGVDPSDSRNALREIKLSGATFDTFKSLTKKMRSADSDVSWRNNK